MCASEAVDLHEKPKNFLTEAEVDRFLQAAKSVSDRSILANVPCPYGADI